MHTEIDNVVCIIADKVVGMAMSHSIKETIKAVYPLIEENKDILATMPDYTMDVYFGLLFDIVDANEVSDIEYVHTVYDAVGGVMIHTIY